MMVGTRGSLRSWSFACEEKYGVRPRVRADWRRVERDQKGRTGRFTVLSWDEAIRTRTDEGVSGAYMGTTGALRAVGPAYLLMEV